MKLTYFQSMNECDPLPKLGKKKIAPRDATQSEQRMVANAFFMHDAHRLDDLDAAISTAVKAAAESVGADTFLKAMSSTTPDLPVVSFADVGEVAEKGATWISAWAAADSRAGSLATFECRDRAMREYTGTDEWGYVDDYPGAEAFVIAALEALR